MNPTNVSSSTRISILLAAIVGISLLHYLTPLGLPMLHDIFQRLYYLPIILAAFWFGLRGGLACSLVVTGVYFPHILFQWGGHSGHLMMDLEKYLEIILYNVVGGVTGFLSQQEQERRAELQKSAEGLEKSLRQLQLQSERIMAIEEQLRRAEKLSVLGELAAVLAHEIRNPLGSLRGTAEILKDDYLPGDRKYEFLEIQIKETERLNHVVEDFLRMAQPQPTELRECALREELETVITLVTADARRRGISLALEPSPPVIIRADGEKLRQAFLNIVLNAIQATPAGGGVTISLIQERNGLDIRFTDTGSGMTPETQSRLFEPFFTTKTGGTGLGMAVTRKIVEAHGGTVLVASEPGRGTTVTVLLPERGRGEP
jgi:two-component system sensor histidine kinase HydH